MNILNPISTIMSTDLITVNPSDKLEKVQAIFDEHRIHHIPVVRYTEIVGIISKTDLLYFLKGLGAKGSEKMLNHIRLTNYTAEAIMTTGIAKLSSTDRIDVALEVFKENLFHAIPIVDDEKLVGIVTTYDIIEAIASSKASI